MCFCEFGGIPKWVWKEIGRPKIAGITIIFPIEIVIEEVLPCQDGPNQLTQEPRLGLFMLFLLQLTSPLAPAATG